MRSWRCVEIVVWTWVALVAAGGLTAPASAEERALKTGDVIRLKCLNKVAGDQRWLMGNGQDGSVKLYDNPQLAATKWRVHKDEGRLLLFCLGSNKAQGCWLDGKTGDGTVRLATQKELQDGVVSGTAWELHVAKNMTVHLKCLGHIEGPRWLYGLPSKGTVKLVKDLRGSGDSWEVVKE